MKNYIGIDGCRAGWLMIKITGQLQVESCLLKSISEINDHINTATGSVFIDMPIGISDEVNNRNCDKMARKILGRRGSSVFPVPVRQILPIKDYELANSLNRQITGKGISKQTFNIMPKINELDRFMQKFEREKPGLMLEAHPELQFYMLNNEIDLQFNKKTAHGINERLVILSRIFTAAEQCFHMIREKYLKKEAADDDIIDALVLAVAAEQCRGDITFLPEEIETDRYSLPMRIGFYRPSK